MKPELRDLRKLWQVVAKWRDKHDVICAESIYQSDRVQEALYELAEDVCDIVGYKEAEAEVEIEVP